MQLSDQYILSQLVRDPRDTIRLMYLVCGIVILTYVIFAIINHSPPCEQFGKDWEARHNPSGHYCVNNAGERKEL